MKKIIGLTGGVASGKSTVSRFLDRLGANVINVDQIGHELQETNEVIELINQTFAGVVTDGVISREKLGKIVFSSKEELQKLNDIMYPRMKEEILNRLVDGINVVDMAILFESGFDTLCDSIAVVHSSVENQIKRMEKRGYDKAKINGILNSQMDPLLKVKKATFVVNNDESIEKLSRKVKNLYNYLMEN